VVNKLNRTVLAVRVLQDMFKDSDVAVCNSVFKDHQFVVRNNKKKLTTFRTNKTDRSKADAV
jgi:hypothetical protein